MTHLTMLDGFVIGFFLSALLWWEGVLKGAVLVMKVLGG